MSGREKLTDRKKMSTTNATSLAFPGFSRFNLHPDHVFASLDKLHYDDHLCLVASIKQQIYVRRIQT